MKVFPKMTKRGVAGPWVSMDQPPPPTSLLRAGRLEWQELRPCMVKPVSTKTSWKGVVGQMLTLECPSPPTSMSGAGKSPGKSSLEEVNRQLLGQGVVQLEDHPSRHVTAALPHKRFNSLRGQGVVTLEDHPTLRHVTGSPPHNQVLNLVGGQLSETLHMHLRELGGVGRLQHTVWGRQSFVWLFRDGGRCWGS